MYLVGIAEAGNRAYNNTSQWLNNILCSSTETYIWLLIKRIGNLLWDSKVPSIPIYIYDMQYVVHNTGDSDQCTL